MLNSTVITVVGNLTDNPELRFTPSGVAMARFTVAVTRRHRPAQLSQRRPEQAGRTSSRSVPEAVTSPVIHR